MPPLETGTYIQDLNRTYPLGTDAKSEGDNHLRLIKTVLLETFPNATKAYRLHDRQVVTVGGDSVAIGTAHEGKTVLATAAGAGLQNLNLTAGLSVDFWVKVRYARASGVVSINPQGGESISAVGAELVSGSLQLPGGYSEITLIKSAAAVWSVVEAVPSASGVPSGSIQAFAGTVVPSGWLACDGMAYSRTGKANLFAAIGETWGDGDGATTFNVPDLNRRTLIGSGGTGTTEVGADVGDTGGEEEHTLTIGEMPSHRHDFPYGQNDDDSGTDISVRISPLPSTQRSYIQTFDSGGGGAHNNMQPSAVVLYIIKE